MVRNHVWCWVVGHSAAASLGSFVWQVCNLREGVGHGMAQPAPQLALAGADRKQRCGKMPWTACAWASANIFMRARLRSVCGPGIAQRQRSQAEVCCSPAESVSNRAHATGSHNLLL